MDTEKLIERLKNTYGECYQMYNVMLDAATALSTLQAENERLRKELEYEREHANAFAVPDPERLDAWRENVRLGLASGVVVLGRDSALEVMELPAEICPVMVEAAGLLIKDGLSAMMGDEPELAPIDPADEAEPLRSRDVARLTDSAAGDEKRAIKERLRAYRAAHGLGCLEQVASKIRHWRGHPDLDAAALRGLLTGDTVLSLVEWRRVGRALAALEAEERKEAGGE